MGILEILRRNDKLSQDGKILRALKLARGEGLYNYQLSKLALRYGSSIRNLRKEGHVIVTVRETKSKFRYVLKDN